MRHTKNNTLIATLICLLGMTFLLFAQDDLKPWERLGLSLTEWKLIQDNELSMNKVEDLLMAGIGIGEYFEQPWESIELTEEKWILLRRSGLTSADIEQQQRVQQGEFNKNLQPAENTFEEQDLTSENRQLLTSFLLPGYLQRCDERKTKGRIMIGLGVGAIGGTVVFSVIKKQFIPLPLLTIFIPDMIWSMVNQKNYQRNSGN